MGTDELGIPGRSRIHTDDSAEVRYYNQSGEPGNGQDGLYCHGRPRMRVRWLEIGAWHMTNCQNDKNGNPKQSFAGWMLYDRTWFHKDLFAMTIGGGAMDNPGQISHVAPADQRSNCGFRIALLHSVSRELLTRHGTARLRFDWMPSQFITFRFETGYRYASVPYFSGRGGITPPGGNVAPASVNGSVGTSASYICTNGTTSAVSNFAPSGNGFTVDNVGNAVATACATQFGSAWTAWQPDLRKNQWANTIAIMVKF